jgi:hypothetical protein
MNPSIFFETLEDRQLLSASMGRETMCPDASFANAAEITSAAAPTDTSATHAVATTTGSTKSSAAMPYATGATAMTYLGTSVSRSLRTTSLKIVLTQMRGVHEGAMYLSSGAGTPTPVTFSIGSNLAFSFKYKLNGVSGTVQGKLSANGATLAGTWTSLSEGVKNSGTFSASRQ